MFRPDPARGQECRVSTCLSASSTISEPGVAPFRMKILCATILKYEIGFHSGAYCLSIVSYVIVLDAWLEKQKSSHRSANSQLIVKLKRQLN